MSINIKFVPTAIGSLPHDNPEKAVELVFKYFPDIPVIGQLANVSPKEDMLSQYNENIPGIVFDEADNRWYMDQESETFFEELEEFFLDYESVVNEKNFDVLEKYAISENHCSTLPFFLKKLKETKPAFVKGQVTGLFTFGTSLVDRDKKCIFYDETLKEIAFKGLTLKALWLMKKFKEASLGEKIDFPGVVKSLAEKIKKLGYDELKLFYANRERFYVPEFNIASEEFKKYGINCMVVSEAEASETFLSDGLFLDLPFLYERMGLYETIISAYKNKEVQFIIPPKPFLGAKSVLAFLKNESEINKLKLFCNHLFTGIIHLI